MNKSVSQSLSFGAYLFVLLFTPLAFGTVENWSFYILETMTAISFLLLLSALVREKSLLLQVPGITPLLLLFALISLQLIPLPAAIVKFIAPATFEVYRPILAIDASNSFIPLTVNRKATLLVLLTFTSYSLFYVLTVYHLSKADRLVKTSAAVAILASVVAVEAIIQKLTSPEMIYWLRPAPPSTYPIGPWIYSNHFAGYMEMLFPLVIALFLYYRPQVHYGTGFKDKIIALFTMPGANRHLLLATGAVLIAVSILLSLSRGGIVTLCLAFLFFIFFTSRLPHSRRINWAVFITVGVTLLFSWLGWQPVIDEFGQFWGPEGLNTSGRLPLYRDTLEIIRAFPVFGTGAGTFLHTYPTFRTIFGDAIFDHAHSDYLEIIAGNGFLGLFFSGWFVFAVFQQVVSRLSLRRDRYSILVTSGALTGMLALLFHCLIDFQIYNGANGLYFFFLCGLAVSAANTRLRFRSRPTLLSESPSRLNMLALGCIAVLLLAATSFTRLGTIKAQKTYASVGLVYANPNIPTVRLEQMHDITTSARELDPLEAFYAFRLGFFSTLLGEQKRAQEEYISAGLLDPMSGAYVQQLGISLPEKKSARKDELLALGLVRDPLAVERYLLYSDWLLSTHRRTQAFVVLQKAMKLNPKKMKDIARYIRDRRFNEKEIAEILPPRPFAWYAMGRISEDSGRKDAAISYYLKALEFLHKDDTRPEYFTRLHILYRQQQLEDRALAILRQGIAYMPDYSWFRIQLGDYYLRQGIDYRAIEEFRTALKLDPDNKVLAKKLLELDQ